MTSFNSGFGCGLSGIGTCLEFVFPEGILFPSIKKEKRCPGAMKVECPLYPRKRTLICVERRTSANRGHPTHLCRFGAAFASFGTRGRRLVGNLCSKRATATEISKPI
jgi:hypothetical protein